MEQSSNTPLPEVSPEDNLDQDNAVVGPALHADQTEERQEYWKRELDAAREERRKFDGAGAKTIQRYADVQDEGAESPHYNLYYANTEIKSAALYSKQPEPDIRRRFMDQNDDVSRVASFLLQRTVVIENDLDNFDQKFKQMLFDYLVPGLGLGWVRYEEEIGEPAVVGVDPLTGQPILGEPEVIEQNTPIDYVAWDDFLWAPCQVWTDCRWIARRVPMSSVAVKGRFGDTVPQEIIDGLSYEQKKSGEKSNAPTDKLKPKNVTNKTVDIIEIWDKESKTIIWVTEAAPIPLDVKDDTNKFPDFFPTPLPPLGNFTTASTLPRSDYSQVQDLYCQLDRLQEKAVGYVEAMKVRFLYDASFKELSDIFKSPEFTGLPVASWASFIQDKAGIQGAMQFIDIGVYVDALAKTNQEIEVVKRQIFDIEGIADFMRAETQKYDSAAATKQKGSFAATRLGVRQKMIALYVEKLIRLKVHLISKFYKPEILVDHAGALPKADEQHLAGAVQLLKSNFHANFRLSVSVDSIQDAQWNTEKGERTALIRTIGEMIATTTPALKENPSLGPLLFELFRWGVAGFKGASEVEGILDATLQKVLQDSAASAGAPKPPSKEEIKASMAAQKNQTDIAIAQMENQTDMAIAQSEAKSRELNDTLEMQDAQMRTAVQAADIQHRAVESANRTAIEIAKLNKP